MYRWSSRRTWLAWKLGDETGARALLEESLQIARQRVSRFPFHWLVLWVQVAMLVATDDLAAAADAAAALLQPPLARQNDGVELHLRRIAAARGGDPTELGRELQLGLAAARGAGYLSDI